MSARSGKRIGFLIACLICLGIAVLAFGGVILGEDPVGRVIFGIVWVALAAVWLGSYFGAFFGRSSRSGGNRR